jgi:hypothetical protein
LNAPANNSTPRISAARPAYQPQVQRAAAPVTAPVKQKAIQQMGKPAPGPLAYRPVQLKILPPQAHTPPKAPPVYFVKSSPNPAQAMIPGALQRKSHPVSPPVYRPQSSEKTARTASSPPRMVQPKALQGNATFPGVIRSVTRPVHCYSNIQRKLSIEGVAANYEDALAYLDDPTPQHEQIVKAWHESGLQHTINKKEKFKEKVNENVETLKSLGKAKKLFKAENFVFATQSDSRTETLYFVDEGGQTTGRLRQQHPSGPLAKIDELPKMHRFPQTRSRKRELKAFHKEHAKEVPVFTEAEEIPQEDSYHIEYAVNENGVTAWHPSEGKVKTSDEHIKVRIRTALHNILGI